MNKTTQFLLALEAQDYMQKRAMAARLGGLFSNLSSKVAPMAENVMGKVQPALDTGFRRIGQAAGRVQNPMLSKLLTGGVPGADMAALSGTAAQDLGKTVAKRVGVGAGAAYGGAVGLEAPGKYKNNQAYEQQQAHPLRAWLAQHMLGKRKLQSRGYLNPLG